jgi:hypothetical protein
LRSTPQQPLDASALLQRLRALQADGSVTAELQLREHWCAEDNAHVDDMVSTLGLYTHVYGRGTATVRVVAKSGPLPAYRADLDARAAGAAPRGVVVSASAAAAVERALLAAPAAAPAPAARNAYVPPQRRAPDAPPPPPRQQLQRPAPPPELAARRASLPVAACRAAFLAAVSAHQVVVVSGETGSGKTTQLPAFVLEAAEAAAQEGANIVVTQPRRIAAVSVAARVAAERGEPVGASVGYAVRLEAARGAATRLLFCTTGVLLRRLRDDASLDGVTHVFVDEIHERGMNEGACVHVL